MGGIRHYRLPTRRGGLATPGPRSKPPQPSTINTQVPNPRDPKTGKAINAHLEAEDKSIWDAKSIAIMHTLNNGPRQWQVLESSFPQFSHVLMFGPIRSGRSRPARESATLCCCVEAESSILLLSPWAFTEHFTL